MLRDSKSPTAIASSRMTIPRAAAVDHGIEIDYETARQMVYGMPYADWKAQHQNRGNGGTTSRL